jgi:hypothetical protein
MLLRVIYLLDWNDDENENPENETLDLLEYFYMMFSGFIYPST